MTITMAAPATPAVPVAPLRFTQQRDVFGDPQWVTTVPGPDGTPVTLTNREVISALHLSAAHLRHRMPADELAQLVTVAVATVGAYAICAHSHRHHQLCRVIATEDTPETEWRRADQERRRMWHNDHGQSSDHRHALCQGGMLTLIDAGRAAR